MRRSHLIRIDNTEKTIKITAALGSRRSRSTRQLASLDAAARGAVTWWCAAVDVRFPASFPLPPHLRARERGHRGVTQRGSREADGTERVLRSAQKIFLFFPRNATRNLPIFVRYFGHRCTSARSSSLACTVCPLFNSIYLLFGSKRKERGKEDDGSSHGHTDRTEKERRRKGRLCSTSNPLFLLLLFLPPVLCPSPSSLFQKRVFHTPQDTCIWAYIGTNNKPSYINSHSCVISELQFDRN